MEALFSVHEGYFGALGTFLKSAFGEDVGKILFNKLVHQLYQIYDIKYNIMSFSYSYYCLKELFKYLELQPARSRE